MGNSHSLKICFWCKIPVGLFKGGGVGEKYFITGGRLEIVPRYMRKYAKFIRLCKHCCDDEEIKTSIVRMI